MCHEEGCFRQGARKKVVLYALLAFTFLSPCYMIGMSIYNLTNPWTSTSSAIIALTISSIGIIIHVILFCALQFEKTWPRGFINVILYVIFLIFETGVFLLAIIIASTSTNQSTSPKLTLIFTVPATVVQVVAICFYIPHFQTLRRAHANVRTNIESQPTVVQYETGHIGQPTFFEPAPPTDDVLPQDVPLGLPPAYSKRDLFA